MRRLYSEFVSGKGAVGLLLLRLVAGLGLMLHGWPKIQHAFNWMGPNAPVPGLFQFLSAFSEFFGGLALILGLLTWLAALGITFNFLVAIVTVHLKAGDPFVNAANPHGPSFETAALYLAAAVTMLLTGPGALSLDANLFKQRVTG